MKPLSLGISNAENLMLLKQSNMYLTGFIEATSRLLLFFLNRSYHRVF